MHQAISEKYLLDLKLINNFYQNIISSTYFTSKPTMLRFLWLTIFTVVLCFTNCYSQNDTKRVEELLELTRKNSRYPDSLEVYGKELLKFKDSLAILEGHFAVGYSFYQKGQMTPAGLHYDTALMFTNAEKEYFTYSRIKRNRAIVHQRVGEFNKAKEGYERLMALAIKKEDKIGEASMHNHLGIVYQFQGDFNKATEAFNKSIDIYTKERPQELTNTMLNLGTLYGRMELIEESNRQLRKAADNARQYNQTPLLARCYNNISVNYRKLNKLDSSNYYLAFCEDIYKRLNNLMQLSLAYQNKASNYLGLGNRDSTYHYLYEARLLNDNTQDLFIEAELDFLEAQTELRFGNPQKAIDFTNRSITKALKQNRIESLDDRYILLSQAYEKAGNATAALNIMRKWKNLKDSLEIYQDIKTIQEITSAYDFARSEEMIKQSQAKTSFFQKMTTRLAIALLVLVFVSIYLFGRYKKKSQEAHLKSSEIKELNEKIEQLQQQAVKTGAKFITLKSKAVIPLDKLMFVQSDGHYLEFFLNHKEKPEIDRGSLRDLKTDLPERTFIQVHRSYIVNVHFIREVYSNKVVLQNDHELNISRSFKTNIDEVFQNKAS